MLHFIVNLLLAFLAGVLTDYVLGRCGISDPIKVVIAVLVGIAVFLANLARYVA